MPNLATINLLKTKNLTLMKKQFNQFPISSGLHFVSQSIPDFVGTTLRFAINQSLKTLTMVIVLAMVANFAKGQITVNSLGQTSIGCAHATGYNLTTKDKVYILNSSGYYGFIFDNSSYWSNSNYGLTFRPSSNNTGVLGRSDMAFAQVWSYSGSINLSDERQKENIIKIDNALGLVLKLQGVKYDLKREYAYNDSLITDERSKVKLEKQRKNQIGLLAQEVEKVLPEAVVYDDSTDIYGVVYSRFIPVLIEAIKEQQNIIENLKIEMQSIKSEANEKSAELSDNTQTAKTLSTQQPTLAQNIPNPFTDNTRIGITLPETVKNARLYVYNMQGIQIKSFDINERGATSVTIEGFSLQAGMYLYTLIADGKEVDTKKMILTK
jgi:hypothetical protein